LKKWSDPDGYAYAVVYTPQQIQHFRSQKKLSQMQGRRIDWQPDDGASGPNPFKVVPVVPVRNDPAMLGGGVSDLQVATPLQDALNKLLSDMLLTSEYMAFPQRVILGVQKLTDAAGNPLTAEQVQLKLSRSRVVQLPGADAKIAEWSKADLDNYVNARQHLVRGLTAKTRTPPHYVLGEIINASGDALTAAETGLVSKTEDKQPAIAEAHEEMQSLCFLAMGDEKRAKIRNGEVIWKDAEHKTFAQRVDGAVKMRTSLNVPEEMAWEAMGFSPQQIERAKILNEAADLLAPAPLPGNVTERITVPETPAPGGGPPPPQQNGTAPVTA
jgi:hypothetical protein